MQMNGKALAAIAIMLWSCGAVLPGCSTPRPLQREMLHSLHGVRVLIEYIDPAIEQEGWSKRRLQTGVERAFSKAGLPTLSAEALSTPSHVPYLEVTVSLKKTELELYSYSFSSRLVQETTQMPALRSMAATSYVGQVGTFEPQPVETLDNAIGALVETFVRLHWTVKPSRNRAQ